MDADAETWLSELAIIFLLLSSSKNPSLSLHLDVPDSILRTTMWQETGSRRAGSAMRGLDGAEEVESSSFVTKKKKKIEKLDLFYMENVHMWLH